MDGVCGAEIFAQEPSGDGCGAALDHGLTTYSDVVAVAIHH
jgi:hypothetical protein